MIQKWIFLGHKELADIRILRKQGRLDEAEKLLLGGEPSEAVLDELRKTYSQKAHAARRSNDWITVLKYLEAYITYAQKWGWYCRKMVNANPPSHTEQDKQLLEEAKNKLGKT